MKTNPLISRLHNCPGTQASSPAKIRLRWLFFFLLFLLLLALVASCKSPATLTNDTQHHTRDSNYHATVHRIETHDTIIIGPLRTPSISPLKGEYTKSPFKGDLEGREGQGGSKSPFKGDLEGLPGVQTSRPRKLSYKEQRELAQLEQQMPLLEEEKAALEQQLSGGLTDPQAIAEASARYEQVQRALDEAELRWLELND